MIVRNGCVVDEEEQREQGEEGQQQGQRTIGGYVKVMTDEQIEILRRQISDYATICEQLVEMHKALTAQQDSIAGMKLGNMYCDPLMGGGHKIATRQRWTPSQMQLQILESIFEQGNGTPSKQKVKDIASELVQHGPISETNVYNWFQNRRARSKRKQQAVASNNAESEVEIEVDSLSEKKAKAEDFQCSEKSSFHADGLGFQGQEVSSCVRLFDPELSHVPSNENFKSCGSLPPLSFFDSMLTNIRVDHLMGRTEGPDFSSFHTNKGFHMIG